MIDKARVVEAGNLLKQSKFLLVVLPQNPSLDSTAAALGLYLSLRGAQKNIQVGCATPMSVAFNRLIGVDKISTKVGSRNLIISLSGLKDSIEEVSTFIEGEDFNIVVSPQKRSRPIGSEKVKFSQAGIQADTIIVIGARKLDDLGSLYSDERDAFNKAAIVAIAAQANGAPFGTINLIDPQISSCSEVAAKLLQKENFSVKGDIATNLIAGIESATNNLQFKTSAETFEVIAWLMRQGGRRGHLGTAPAIGVQMPQTMPAMGTRAPFPVPVTPQFAPQPAPVQNQMGRVSPPFQQNQPAPAQPAPVFSQPTVQTPQSAGQTQPPIVKETEATDVAQEGESTAEGGQTKPSPDWYQPKIYKGKTTV